MLGTLILIDPKIQYNLNLECGSSSPSCSSYIFPAQANVVCMQKTFHHPIANLAKLTPLCCPGRRIMESIQFGT